ncbi:hypothetical protein G6677_07830 [Polynucleobacter paneuropaeus]|nr:hypothetical protein [Polynucleobacter paneuropaeus]
MFAEYKNLIKEGMLSDLEHCKHIYETIENADRNKVDELEKRIISEIKRINSIKDSKDCRKAVVYCLIFRYLSQYKYKIHDTLFIGSTERTRKEFIESTVSFFQKFDEGRGFDERKKIKNKDVRIDCFKSLGIEEAEDWEILPHTEVRIRGICQLPNVDNFVKIATSYIFDKNYYLSPYEIINFSTSTIHGLNFPHQDKALDQWERDERKELDWSRKYDERIAKESSSWFGSKKWINHFKQKKIEHLQQIDAYLSEVKSIYVEVKEGHQFLLDWRSSLLEESRLSMIIETINAYKDEIPLATFLLKKGLSQMETLKFIKG